LGRSLGREEIRGIYSKQEMEEKGKEMVSVSREDRGELTLFILNKRWERSGRTEKKGKKDT